MMETINYEGRPEKRARFTLLDDRDRNGGNNGADEAQLNAYSGQEDQLGVARGLPTASAGAGFYLNGVTRAGSPPLREDDKDGHYMFELGENITPRYKIISKMGEGTFGQVLECWDREVQEYVAIKVIRNVQKYRDAAMIEIDVLHTLGKHDKTGSRRCVQIKDWFDFRNHVCIVCERLGPSLYDFLRKNNYRPFSVDLVRAFGSQLLESVAYMHDLTLIHTDLKPENILLVSSEYIKIPDFKSCRMNPILSDDMHLNSNTVCNFFLSGADEGSGTACLAMHDGVADPNVVIRVTSWELLEARWTGRTAMPSDVDAPGPCDCTQNHLDESSVHLLQSGKYFKRVPKSSEMKLIDFGSATFDSHYHCSVVSTRHYRAPEVILGLGWTYPCDLWSVGCILVELCSGDALFQTHENLEHLAMMERVLGPIPQHMVKRADRRAEKYFRHGRELNWPEGAASRESIRDVRRLPRLRNLIMQHVDHSGGLLIDLLQGLLKFEPSERMTAKEALKHSFFRETSRRL